MQFTHNAQVEEAMRAAFNNPERAVEYLVTGLPQQEINPAAHTIQDTAQQEGNLSFLHSYPQFHRIRDFIRQNPEHFNIVLQEMERINPELYQIVTHNQAEFHNLIWGTNNSDGANGNQAEINVTRPDFDATRSVVLDLTSDEAEAVERIKTLGFPEAIVLQVFLACGRDEQLTLNILLNDEWS